MTGAPWRLSSSSSRPLGNGPAPSDPTTPNHVDNPPRTSDLRPITTNDRPNGFLTGWIINHWSTFMARHNYTFTSESVSEGHPDKVCDRISDAILDAFLARRARGPRRCETFATTNRVVIGGEVGLVRSSQALRVYGQGSMRSRAPASKTSAMSKTSSTGTPAKSPIFCMSNPPTSPKA